MKLHKSVPSKPARLATFLLTATLTPFSAHAADLVWSGTNSSIWDTSALNWQTGSVAWSQTSATVPLNRAFFNSAAGTVTIGENLSAQTINFTGNGTTFSAASARTITLVSSGVSLSNQITLADSAAATIGNNVTMVLSTPPAFALPTVSVGTNATLTVAGPGARISTGITSAISGAGSVIIGTGGQYAQTAGSLVVGGGGGGTLRVEGGSVSVATNLVLNNSSSGTSAITLSSGSISTPTAAATGGVRFGGTGGSGVFNLDGGTLTTSKIYENNAAVTSTFNFNGGTLTVGQTNDTDFMTGLNTAAVKAGGALINTQANNATIAQALTTDATLGGAPDGGLTKSGSGRLSLTGTNTYTGTTTVNAGTLAMGVNNTFADVSNFTMAGGTLAVGAFSDTVGTLNLTANSTITLGLGGTFAFADSSALEWGSNTLSITGSFVDGSSIRFGTSDAGLTSGQLALITINGLAASINSAGFLSVSAIPEPSTYAALAGLGVMSLAAYRRRRQTQR
jgi:autotransporter-associated beta strand protein